MLSFTFGYTQTVEYADIVGQVIVEYDVVAPTEITDVISYQLFVDSDTTGEIMVGETDLLVYTIIFTTEEEYKIGVRTKREVHLPSFTDVTYSDINWSIIDIPVGSTPNPFVLRFIKQAKSSMNLRLQ